jgi:hypothetical protein
MRKILLRWRPLHLNRLMAGVGVAWAMFVVCATAVAAVSPVATLSTGEPASQIRAVAADAGMVAAVEFDGNEPGVPVVFPQHGASWNDASASAALVDSSGAAVPPSRTQPNIAVSGGEVAVQERNAAQTQSFEDVFVEPSTGWAGVIPQAAQLVASDGAQLGPPSIDGDVVAAVGELPQTGQDAVYVFEAPNGVWSGVLHQVAELTDSNGAGFEGLTYGETAVAGSTIAVELQPAIGHTASRTDVFTAPAGDWSAVTHQSATLRTPQAGPISMVGDTVSVGGDVVVEPRGGWHGQIPSTAVVWPGNTLLPNIETDAFTGQFLALTSASLGPQHGCPCGSGLTILTRPAGGWTGTLDAQSFPAPPSNIGELPVAAFGTSLFVADGSTITLDQVTGPIGAPSQAARIATARVHGLTSRSPRVDLTIDASAGPPITSVSVRLIGGLSFATSRRDLRHGVVGTGRFGTVALAGGRLIVTPVSGVRTLRLEVRAPLLITGRALSQASRGARLRSRLSVIVTDGSGRKTTSSVTLP